MERTRRPIDSLFPGVRQRLLAATLLSPDKRWYLRELAVRIEATPSSLQRELQNLVEAGILQRTVSGNRAYFQADASCPFFAELQGLLKKTLGGADVLATALEPLRDQIQAAFVYGSFAVQTDLRNDSDIDLMVVGTVSARDLATALAPAEQSLGREVNATLYSPSEFDGKLSQGHHFLSAVLRSPRIPILGDTDVVG